MIDDAYDEGSKAFENDLDFCQNPYPEGTFKATAWGRGWTEASERDWAGRWPGIEQ
ncbi:hypothetical protein [Burkholderia ambifaria]|uniref:hypothetical protein n=1 Tax=Burkholderia ambifaria TaxID=152480 RepID=UPI00158AC078|nr:hypothetical protein [Burkholderia ambifaria]